MNRKILLVTVAMIVLIAVVIVLIAAIPSATTHPAIRAANDFMSAIKENNFDAAYHMVTPQWRIYMPENSLRASFADWGLVNWGFSASELTDNEAHLLGNAKSSKLDTPLKLELYLIKQDGTWLINSFFYSLDQKSQTKPAS